MIIEESLNKEDLEEAIIEITQDQEVKRNQKNIEKDRALQAIDLLFIYY